MKTIEKFLDNFIKVNTQREYFQKIWQIKNRILETLYNTNNINLKKRKKSDFLLDWNKWPITFKNILNQLGDPKYFPSYEETYKEIGYDEAYILFRKWKLNKKDFDKISNEFEIIQNHNKIIKCNNLDEFQKIVQALPISDERKASYITHEWEHGKVAEKYNLNHIYQLTFSQVPQWQEWRFHVQPSINIEYPINLSFEEYQKICSEVISHPEVLSDWDIKQLKAFLNQ
jgi:hypothetical protein